MEFRWNEWNVTHLWEHGVYPAEAEAVVRSALSPFPRAVEDGKFMVWGQGQGGRLLQVVFVIDDDDQIFVIHARPLSPAEKRRRNRGRRKRGER